MKKLRILAFLMAVVMVAALFAACSGTEPETTTAATTTEATTAGTTEAPVTEATTTEATTTEATTEAPKTYDGYEFTIRPRGTHAVFPATDDNGAYVSAEAAELAELLEQAETELDVKFVSVDLGNVLETLTIAGRLFGYNRRPAYFAPSLRNKPLPHKYMQLLSHDLSFKMTENIPEKLNFREHFVFRYDRYQRTLVLSTMN